MTPGPRYYEDSSPLAHLEDTNQAPEPEQPFTVDDTGRGWGVCATALLIVGSYIAVDWILWDAIQRAQEVQPW